jgi:serine protease Do
MSLEQFMIRLFIAVIMFVCSNLSVAHTSHDTVSKISEHMVKIYVSLPNGYGLGSGVVIADNQVITSCHVVSSAQNIKVTAGSQELNAKTIKADWYHDLCILEVNGIQAPVVNMSTSKVLQYEQPVYSIGFANNLPQAKVNYGHIKGLFPFDDSVVIRTSNTFKSGDSGGGLFDEMGNLVGIITVKSPGENAYYYHMPVDWVKKLMAQPEQVVGITKGPLPFWAKAPETWPYFMRVVTPLKKGNWAKLNEVATQWSMNEPDAVEALFYRAVAEYNLNMQDYSALHLNQVLGANQYHSHAMYYLGLIAEKKGQHSEALQMASLLDNIDATTATSLRTKIGER